MHVGQAHVPAHATAHAPAHAPAHATPAHAAPMHHETATATAHHLAAVQHKPASGASKKAPAKPVKIDAKKAPHPAPHHKESITGPGPKPSKKATATKKPLLSVKH
uniref:Uncharacterized protein n=1 Tax=Favella ehrenbergii TaxID=182087 RepID=A0A7S3MQM0_9SPIT